MSPQDVKVQQRQQLQEVTAELTELEAFLLHHDHRADPSRLETMLAADLTEVNAQGLRVGRDDIVCWLLSKSPEARWIFEEVEASNLGEDHVLLCYVARQVAGGGSGRPGRHASVWRWKDRVRQSGTGESGTAEDASQSAGGAWQLLFHQATRVDSPG